MRVTTVAVVAIFTTIAAVTNIAASTNIVAIAAIIAISTIATVADLTTIASTLYNVRLLLSVLHIEFSRHLYSRNLYKWRENSI